MLAFAIVCVRAHVSQSVCDSAFRATKRRQRQGGQALELRNSVYVIVFQRNHKWQPSKSQTSSSKGNMALSANKSLGSFKQKVSRATKSRFKGRTLTCGTRAQLQDTAVRSDTWHNLSISHQALRNFCRATRRACLLSGGLFLSFPFACFPLPLISLLHKGGLGMPNISFYFFFKFEHNNCNDTHIAVRYFFEQIAFKSTHIYTQHKETKI